MSEQIGSRMPDGMKIGGAVTDKISVYGVTPIVQRSGAAQAAVTTAAITVPGTTAATSTTPFGYASTTQADAVPASIVAIDTRVDALTVLVNELQASMVAFGVIKGS